MGILCVFCVYDTIGNRCFEKTSFPKMIINMEKPVGPSRIVIRHLKKSMFEAMTCTENCLKRGLFRLK